MTAHYLQRICTLSTTYLQFNTHICNGSTTYLHIIYDVFTITYGIFAHNLRYYFPHNLRTHFHIIYNIFAQSLSLTYLHIIYTIFAQFQRRMCALSSTYLQKFYDVFAHYLPHICTVLRVIYICGSGGVVNFFDFCPASLKSLGCFYFRCLTSSQWKAVTINSRSIQCQL